MIIEEINFTYLNVYKQIYITQMNFYVEIQSKTWDKRENLNLFDHEEVNIKMQKLKIYKSGIILRDCTDFNISFIPEEENEKINTEQKQILFGLQKKDNSFDIVQKGGKQQIIYTLVSNTLKMERFIILQGDLIKIGKKEVKILKLYGKKYQTNNTHYNNYTSQPLRPFNSHYFQSIRSSDFNTSELEQIPTCRFCLSHTHQSINPVINCCSCSGSAKYVHRQCLSKWICPRVKRNNIKSRLIYSIMKKGVICQLCRTFFDFDLIISIIFGNNIEIKNYCILQILDSDEQIYILNFSEKNEIIIGRGTNSDLDLSDITASRTHCKIIYEEQNKKFYIKDLGSKFGTLVQLRNEKINDTIQIQKGRTILKLTRKKAKNILQKLMSMCGVGEQVTDDEKTI